MSETYFDAMRMNGADFLEHHGILGQKWGVRRYQDYDGSLTSSGKSRYGKTKYTNIDGSINEEGKMHFQKFASKQIKKNNKYYDKHIKKYKKLQNKVKDNDPDMAKKFGKMIEDAEKSKAGVNESISKMDFDQALTYEKQQRQKKLKALGIAGGIVGLAGLGTAAALGAEPVKGYMDGKDPSTIMDDAVNYLSNSKVGQVTQQTLETGIRAYSDARAYVFAIGADEALNRIEKSGVHKRAGQVLGESVNSFTNTAQPSIERLVSSSTNALTGAANHVTNNLLNNASKVNNGTKKPDLSNMDPALALELLRQYGVNI